MTYIYGAVYKRDRPSPEALEVLRKDLSRYPYDDHRVFEHDSIAGGIFHQRLRKAPFPIDEPMQDEASGIVIFASARLDYRQELLRKLSLPKDELYNLSDTQLILKAYLKWGESCVEHLEGDFGFVIWNPANRYFWGACDPIGFRPVFFSIHDQNCYFSSHTKGLSRLPFVNHKPDEAFYQSRLLRLETLSSLSTPYEGIKQIPAGHSVKIDGASVSVHKYYEWQIVPTRKKVYRNDYAEELAEIFSAAVDTRLYDDYPVGGFLSGGLDSSTVLGLADGLLKERGTGRNLITTSTVHHKDSKDPRENERPWVETFKKHFPDIEVNYCCFTGTPPLRLDNKEFFGTMRFRRYPALFGEELMEKTLIERGCRTVLTGWRGDHFISRRGYSSYSELLKRGKLIQFISAIRGTADFLGRKPINLFKSVIKSNIPEEDLKSIEFPGESFLNPEWIRQSNQRIQQPRPTKPGWSINDVNWDIVKRLPDYTGSHQYYEDLSFRHSKTLLRLNPLSDPRVINFALKLPAEEFLKQGMDRSIMRRAIKQTVPDELRLRRTKGSFMGDESKICASLHYQWLCSIDLPQLIDRSPLARYVNREAMLKFAELHKHNIQTGDVHFDFERTYFLNLLGYFLFFDDI